MKRCSQSIFHAWTWRPHGSQQDRSTHDDPARVGRNGRHALCAWFGLLAALALSLAPACTGAEAQASLTPQPKPLDLKVPGPAVVLMGAKCITVNCWLSSFFAPAILENAYAPIALTNTSDRDVMISARFFGTNGLGLEKLGTNLTLAGVDSASQNLLAGTNPPKIPIKRGETAQLKLALMPGLPPGSYAGEIRLEVTAVMADPISKTLPITAKVRTSVTWVILAALLGILVGRLAQLVYDPRMILRVETLDWLNDIAVQIGGISDPAVQQRIAGQLKILRERLFERSVDTAALRLEIQTLEVQVRVALAGASQQLSDDVTARNDASGSELRRAPSWPASAGGLVGKLLRILAGVTPLPLPSVYGWLLPLFVLSSLAALTVVFVVQQYASGGTAETFGAGGIADFAAIFLAGVASDAIAGGLRNVKLR